MTVRFMLTSRVMLRVTTGSKLRAGSIIRVRVRIRVLSKVSWCDRYKSRVRVGDSGQIRVACLAQGLQQQQKVKVRLM